jgi:tRNA pseudouridine38-40 synthase
MNNALVHLRGTHDFKAFEGAGSPRAHSVRKVSKAEFFKRDGDRIDFEIEANGFLRHMVRNIIGTLIDIGHLKISSDDLGKIRETEDRGKAGITAPPHGLFLVEVKYLP